MLKRNRRIVATALLAALGLGFAVTAVLYFRSLGWHAPVEIAAPLILIVLLVVATNAARSWRGWQKRRRKKVPSYLRVVRDENETLH